MVRRFVGLVAVGAVLTGTAAWVGHTPAPAGQVIVVKMVDVSATEYKYVPSSVAASPGDTVRFLQTGTMPHNVQFKVAPDGANIDGIMVGPFLTSPNETYDLVIDDRFVAGEFPFVCTPHEALGMTGTLTITPRF